MQLPLLALLVLARRIVADLAQKAFDDRCFVARVTRRNFGQRRQTEQAMPWLGRAQYGAVGVDDSKVLFDDDGRILAVRRRKLPREPARQIAQQPAQHVGVVASEPAIGTTAVEADLRERFGSVG